MKKINLFLALFLIITSSNALVAKAKQITQECSIKSVTNCPFCQIANGKNKHQVIKEGKNVIAIRKNHPVVYGQNFLVIPKEHHVNLIETDAKKAGEIFAEMIEMIQELSKNGKTGHFTIVMNNGSQSAQTVFHMHMHVKSPDSDWGFKKNQ